MWSTFLLSVLLIATSLNCWAFTAFLENNIKQLEQNIKPRFSLRSKRAGGVRLVQECMLVGLEEASYFYKSRGQNDVCGLYLLSPADFSIEVTVDFVDTSCEEGGLLSILDGWEMSGQVFPPVEDLPMDNRVENICGKVKKRLFISTTNAVTVLYKFPTLGNKFKLTVKFNKHPKPCNILLIGDSEVITLRNHGLHRNCSLATVFPAVIRLLQVNVGMSHLPRRLQGMETGVLTKCNRANTDVVQIGGSMGLNTAAFEMEEAFCGLDSNPKFAPFIILCEVSTVRLVSSASSENSVTVAVTPFTDLSDIELSPTTVCGEQL